MHMRIVPSFLTKTTAKAKGLLLLEYFVIDVKVELLACALELLELPSCLVELVACLLELVVCLVEASCQHLLPSQLA